MGQDKHLDIDTGMSMDIVTDTSMDMDVAIDMDTVTGHEHGHDIKKIKGPSRLRKVIGGMDR
jgi:hypothetical protein